MNGTLSFWFLPPQTLMIEGGEYHDSSEELQNIVEWYPLSISDSKSPQTWPNRDVFYFLDSRISVRL